MSDKNSVIRGHVKDGYLKNIQGGHEKPAPPTNVRPTQPPPAPKSQPKK
jgi:hypothetical protein